MNNLFFYFKNLKKNNFLLFFFILSLFFTKQISAQVIINEYSCANLNQFFDAYGKHEDWIEVYNNSINVLDISGYYLSDDINDLKKWKFPLETVLPPKANFRVWCSGRTTDTISIQNLHTNFKLKQTKNNPEKIILSDKQGNILDSLTITITQLGHSVARKNNGNSTWSICTKPTIGTTNETAFNDMYMRYALKPTMSLDAGNYTNQVEVKISTDEPNSKIYYTTDGTEPTKNSTIYTIPVLITKTTVLKAKVFSTDSIVLPSFTQFKTYFINESSTLPIISVGADYVQALANGDGEIKPIGSIEYFDATFNSKARSYGELNRHGQDSWVNDQRSLDWVSRDEMGYSAAIKEKLFDATNRKEFQRIILRASGDDNYPATDANYHDGSAHMRDDYVQTLAQKGGLQLDVRTATRCIVFLNGDYWGVYSIRELPDDSDYTEYYYNQDKYNIQYMLTWGNTWAEYDNGDTYNDWATVPDLVLNNNMADVQNFETLNNKVDLISFIDYFLINLNVVCTDWLNYNTGWWRGLNPNGGHKKWGYILWDNDATFDYYINYTGIPNSTVTAKPCDLENFNLGFWSDDPGKHYDMMLKLLDESPEFRQLYLNRLIDLNNTVFSCDNMLNLLDEMTAIIEPEMQRHIERWGGSYDEWKTDGIDNLRNFISQRCNLYDEGIQECYHMTGKQIVFKIEPPMAGSILINSIHVTQPQFEGMYYTNFTNNISAEATINTNYIFDKWTSSTGTTIIAPNINAIEITAQITDVDTITAHFIDPTAIPTVQNPANNNTPNIRAYPTQIDKNQTLTVEYIPTENNSTVITLYNIMGSKITEINLPITHTPANQLLTQKINLQRFNINGGTYLVNVKTGNYNKTIKIQVY